MKQSIIKLSSANSDECLSKDYVVKKFYNNLYEIITTRKNPVNRIKIRFYTSKNVFNDYLRDEFVNCLDSMNLISNKHFSFYLPSVVVLITLELIEITEGPSKIEMICINELRESIVKNPYETRANEVDGSIDQYFDNIGQLHGMGLKFKLDEKIPAMEVLWQFNGKAKDDTCESLRLEITGGSREHFFENNKSRIYSILKMQDHFVLRAIGDIDTIDSKTDIVKIKLDNVCGDLIEGKFDFSHNQWIYRICNNVIIDDETYFGSDTWYTLEKPITITIGETSIKIQSKGRPSGYRKIIGWL